MKPSEVIREARSVLMEDDWCRFASGEGDGVPHCAEGALCRAIVRLTGRRDHDLWMMARRTVADSLGVPFLWSWNDSQAASIHDVLDAFDGAEKYALIAEESDA